MTTHDNSLCVNKLIDKEESECWVQADNLAGPRAHRQRMRQEGEGRRQLRGLPVPRVGESQDRGEHQVNVPQEEHHPGKHVSGFKVPDYLRFYKV